MPKRILIIGAFFCLSGLFALWDVVWALLHSALHINFGVCLLFVGIGLLRGTARSRSWAYVWIILGYLICVLMAVVGTTDPMNLHGKWFGTDINGIAATPVLLASVSGVASGLFCIQKLLSSRRSNEYFGRRSRA